MAGNAPYDAWVGNRQCREELLTRAHVDGLNALLDREEGIPLGLQWMLCQDRARQSQLGEDGHPRRGDFLPPVTLPRRMWAAGEIRFLGEAAPGQLVTRDSTIATIDGKTGRSGALVFVRVDHGYRVEERPWLEEQHTIVYREAGVPGQAAAIGEPLNLHEYPFRQRIATDTVQLFRYSALTFNGHRIHYDQRYVSEVEGYPGLIVHGPLMATWLMNFADTLVDGRALERFAFRVKAPVFVGDTVTLLAREEHGGLELGVADGRDRRVMEATAALRTR